MSLIRENQDTQISCISEDDETQFGEVPATVLAAANKRYVPIYTDLLRVWDLDHAVRQFEVVEHLVEVHGKNAETDALTACVADWV